MQRLGLVGDRLQGNSVGDELIVDDGLFLVRWTVRSQPALPAEVQVLRELVAGLTPLVGVMPAAWWWARSAPTSSTGCAPPTNSHWLRRPNSGW